MEFSRDRRTGVIIFIIIIVVVIHSNTLYTRWPPRVLYVRVHGVRARTKDRIYVNKTGPSGVRFTDEKGTAVAAAGFFVFVFPRPDPSDLRPS